MKTKAIVDSSSAEASSEEMEATAELYLSLFLKMMKLYRHWCGNQNSHRRSRPSFPRGSGFMPSQTSSNQTKQTYKNNNLNKSKKEQRKVLFRICV